MSDAGNADALQQAIMKPEDDRTEADWELLANALESDKSQVEQAAQAAGTQIAE
jgi:hypothetical protein